MARAETPGLNRSARHTDLHTRWLSVRPGRPGSGSRCCEAAAPPGRNTPVPRAPSASTAARPARSC